MKWIILAAVGLVCVSVVWVLFVPVDNDPVAPPPTERAPAKFDTQSGQEMRPQWSR